jgi:hypothetical protein
MRASDVNTLTVRVGAHNLANSAREAGIQNVGVKLVVKHKDFTMETLVCTIFDCRSWWWHHSTNFLHLQHSDIAILVLKSPIKYTATVRKVCLPQGKSSYEGKLGTVVGWGLLREGGSRPTVLQELTMKIWKNSECSSTYGSTAPAGIMDTMLCAGKQGSDSCSVSKIGIGIGIGMTNYQNITYRETAVDPMSFLMVTNGNKLVWYLGVLDVARTSSQVSTPELPIWGNGSTKFFDCIPETKHSFTTTILVVMANFFR